MSKNLCANSAVIGRVRRRLLGSSALVSVCLPLVFSVSFLVVPLKLVWANETVIGGTISGNGDGSNTSVSGGTRTTDNSSTINIFDNGAQNVSVIIDTQNVNSVVIQPTDGTGHLILHNGLTIGDELSIGTGLHIYNQYTVSPNGASIIIDAASGSTIAGTFYGVRIEGDSSNKISSLNGLPNNNAVTAKLGNVTTGANGRGISIEGTGSKSITVDGAINAGLAGIIVDDTTSPGDVKVDAKGAVTVLGVPAYGVYARTGSGDIDIDTAAITANNSTNTAIYAKSLSGGNVDVKTTGDININKGAGIYAETTSSATLTVESTAAINSKFDGIEVRTESGAITIKSGDVTSSNTGFSNSAIDVVSTAGSTVDLTLGGNLSGGTGVLLDGTTNSTISGTGTITGTGDFGVRLLNVTGTSSITQFGKIMGKGAGILFGTSNGSINIGGGGDITGGLDASRNIVNAGQNGIQGSITAGNGSLTINRGTHAGSGDIVGAGSGINVSINASSGGTGLLSITVNNLVEGKDRDGIYAAHRNGNTIINTVAGSLVKGKLAGINSTVYGSGNADITIDADGSVTGATNQGIKVHTAGGTGTVGGDGAVAGVTGGIWVDSTGGAIIINGDGTTTASGNAAKAIYAIIDSTAPSANGITINRLGLAKTTGAGANRTISAERKSAGAGAIMITTGDITDDAGVIAHGVDVYMNNAASTGKIGIDTTAGTISMNGTGASKGIYAVTDGSGTIGIDSGAIHINGSDGTGIDVVTAFTGSSIAAIDIDVAGAITGGAIGIEATIKAAGAGGTIDIDTGAGGNIGNGGAGNPATAGIKTTALDGKTTITLGANVSSGGDGILASSTTGDIEIKGTGNITGGTSAGDDGIDVTTTSGNATVSVDGIITGDPGIVMTSSAGGDLSISGAGKVEGTLAEGIKLATTGGDGNLIVNRNGDVKGATDGISVQTLNGGTGNGTVSIVANTGKTITGTASRGIFARTDHGTIDLDINGAVNGATNGIEFQSVDAQIDLDIASSGEVTGGTNAIFSSLSDKVTINNAGTINGLVNVAGINSATSKFTNSGTWNGFGGNSVFAGSFVNTGTFNLQNGLTNDKFTIGNGLTLDAGSFLKIDVDNANSSDLIDVQGSVTLGGTLDVKAKGVSSDYKKGSDYLYTIIQNDGVDAVTGAFATLTTNYAFLNPSVDSAGGDGNDVVLKLSPKKLASKSTTVAKTGSGGSTVVASSSGSSTESSSSEESSTAAPNFKPYAGSSNSRNAARSLDDFNYDDEEGEKVYDAVIGLSVKGANTALDQISGKDTQSAAAFANRISGAFQQTLLSRGNVGSARGGAPSSLSAYGSEDQKSPASAALDDITNDSAAYTKIWASAFGAVSSVEGNGGLAGVSSRAGGIAIGVEGRSPDSEWVLGVSTGYAKAHFSTTTAGSSSSSDNYHVGLYALWGATAVSSTGWGVSGVLDYAHHEYASRRALTFGGISRLARADYSGRTIGGEVKVRYGVETNGLVWAPVAGLNFAQTNNDPFAETGAGSLNISSVSTQANRWGSLLGIEFSRQAVVNDHWFRTSLSVGWRHEFGDVNQINSYALQGSPTRFLFASPEEARDRIAIDTGIEFSLNEHSSMVLSAHGEKSETSHQYGGNVTYKMKF